MSRTTGIVALATCAVILSSGSLSASEAGGKHWTYNGDFGAEHWGQLAKEYSLCGSGQVQSPININNTVSAKSFDLNFSYQGVPLQILNNGHTIQVNYSTESNDEESHVSINGERHALPSAIQYNSGLSISGEYYKLLHVHFHSPGEHHIGGKPYVMEAHFIHENNQGQRAIVGVMMKSGKSNKFLSQLWPHMPTSKAGPNTINGVSINAEDLLPNSKSYYHYRGSMTTPPCSEGVRWFVMRNSVEVSDAQLNKFLSVVGKNARPMQAVNQRPLIRSK